MKKPLLITLLFWSAGTAFATGYFSRATGGAWNANATWSTAACNGAAAGAFPVSGDTAQICTGDTVTATVPAVVGASGVAGTTAITITGGTLVVNGTTLTAQGDVDWQSGTLTCQNVGTWKWKGPAGVLYQTKTSTGSTKTFNFNSCTSTSDLSSSGLNGLWELGGASGIGVNLNITSSTFTNCGDASNACIGTACGSFGCTSQVVTGNLFNAVGSVDLTSSGTGGTTQTHSSNTYINPLMTRAYRVRNDTAPTTGSCTIANNVVYNGGTTGVSAHWWAKGCTAVTGNININTASDRGQNTLGQGDSANAYLYWDGDLATGPGQLDAPNTECAVVSSGNLYYTHTDNPHTHSEGLTGCGSTTNSYTLSVSSGDNYHKSDSGEFVVPANSASATFNILIDRQGEIFSAITTTTVMTADHNTVWNSEPGHLGETAGSATQLLSYKNNLLAKIAGGFGQASFFVRQSTIVAPNWNAFYGMCGSGEIGAAACPADLDPPYLTNTTLGITGYMKGSGHAITNLATKSATAGTTTTALVCTGCAFVTNSVQVGDWVVRTTGGAGTFTSGRVTAVTDETHIVMTAVTSLTSGDTFDVRTSYWNTAGLQYGQAGVGDHDIHTNPNFTDSTKSMCSWANAVSGQSFNCAATGGFVATAGTGATTIVCSTCTFQTWGITTSDTVAVGTTASTGIRGMSNVVSVDSQTQITIGSIAGTIATDIFSFITPVRNLARAMATKNGFDYTGAVIAPNTNATVAAGLLYIRTAFTPRNTALATAASDGTFIGAQQPVAGCIQAIPGPAISNCGANSIGQLIVPKFSSGK